MKSAFLSPLIYEDLIGGRFIKIHEPFIYFSELLNCEIEVPIDFICDLESVPLVKGTSNRGGVLHDYLCRKDSIPVVDKQVAADVYKEVQICRDEQLNEGFFMRMDRAFRRSFKTFVVRVAPGYFHKLKIMASLEEVTKEV